MNLFARSFLLFLLTGAFAALPAQAQEPGTTIGLGGQIGDPSGVSFKFYEQPDRSYDFLLALDLNDDFFFLNAHRLAERPLGTEAPLRYYYGPGVILGLDGDDEDDDNDVVLGVSVTLGANLFIERFEVFLNLTPRLRVLPATDGALGGGGGLRYYF